MALRRAAAFLTLLTGVALLVGAPVLVGVYLRGAGTVQVAQAVIPCVAIMVGVLAGVRRAWLWLLSCLVGGWDLRRSAGTFRAADGTTGLVVVIGRRLVLAAREAVAGAGTPGPVHLEFPGRRGPITREARPRAGDSGGFGGSRPPVAVALELSEPLPWWTSPLSVGRLGRDPGPAGVDVICLDGQDEVQVLDRVEVSQGRATNVSLTAASVRAGGFVVVPMAGRVAGMLRHDVRSSGPGGGPSAVTPSLRVADVHVPAQRRARFSWPVAATAAGLAVLLGWVGWMLTPTPPAPVVVRFAGWSDYVTGDPRLEDLFRRQGLQVEAEHASSGATLISLVAEGRYDAYTVSNSISASLLLAEMERRGVGRRTAVLEREPMVVGTYLPVLRALQRDPKARLARRGPDGVLRLDLKALVDSLVAQYALEEKHVTDPEGLIRWRDLGDFPDAWRRDQPVSIAAASPCDAGGGIVLAGMVLRELQAETPGDKKGAAARAARALNRVYEVLRNSPGHSSDLAKEWAYPVGAPPSPFTLMYENEALHQLVNVPDEPRIGERVLLYLDDPVTVDQQIIVRDPGPGNRLLDLLNNNSTADGASRIREIEAERLGVRFPGRAAQKARDEFIARHGLAQAMTSGGQHAAEAPQGASSLPNAAEVRPLLEGLCPGSYPR